MTTYENVMLNNRASIKEFANAVKFCAYLMTLDDNFTEAGGGLYKLYNPYGEEIYFSNCPSIYTLINPSRAMSGNFTLKIIYGDGCSATTEQFIHVFKGFNSVTVIDVIHPTVGNSDGG